MDMAGKYVDGFVVPVPKDSIQAYKTFSEKAGRIWKEHGALEYVECIADDVKSGKLTSFPQSVKLEADEIVVFSWIVHKSREDRDRVNAAVMSDRGLKMDPKAKSIAPPTHSIWVAEVRERSLGGIPHRIGGLCSGSRWLYLNTESGW